MIKFSSPSDNAVAATYLYLRYIGAKVTEDTVEETLKDHPDYPSLLATSDALNEWNIENVSLRVKPEQLIELPTPFLTYLHEDGGIFALVKSVSSDTVEWIHTEQGIKREKTQDFLRKWSGVVLLAETNEHSGEKNYSRNRRKQFWMALRYPIVLLILLTIIINIFYHYYSSNWYYNTLLITKLTGLIVSSILLWQNIDKTNPFIRTLCQLGTKTNCNSILNSNAAQITPWLSWSEVGFFYFAGGFITLLMAPVAVIFFQILTSLAIFYAFWSIYYQGFIAKQWCILCLVIQVILGVEFFISLPNLFTFFNKPFSDLDFNNFLIVLHGSLAPILAWFFLKPIFQRSQQTIILKNDLRKFKNSPELFLNQLHGQPKMPFVPKTLNPVTIGDSSAPNTITMVTNPFCQPCAEMHRVVKELIEANKELNCHIIFVASNFKEDKRGVIGRAILSIPLVQQAALLDVWYKNEDQDVDKWLKKNNINENEMASKILEQHWTWVKLAKIRATPTVYFNGYKLPELYQVKDLRGLVKTLSNMDFAKS